jgi:hypothetical protein
MINTKVKRAIKTSSFLLISVCFVFAGCLSKTPKNETATLQIKDDEKKGGLATLVVGFSDWRPPAVRAHIVVDGEEKAIIRARRWTEFNVPSGRRRIDFLFSIWSSPPNLEFFLDCKPGDKRYLVYSIDGNVLSMFPALIGSDIKVIAKKRTNSILEISKRIADIWFNDYEFIPQDEQGRK